MLDIDAHINRADFTFDVKVRCEGPVSAIFGPSGSGKTTLLNIVAGLISPQRGHVRFGDEIWFDSTKAINVPPHHRHIGYVFQDARLFPHLSVRYNLSFSSMVRRADSSSINPKVARDDVIEVLGLTHLLARAPLTLSGGEQQRVALGRALLSHPKLLLMDEPLAALDAPRRNEILPYIENIQKKFSIPTLYVSHARDEVERIADEIITLHEGSLAHVKRGATLW